MHKVLSFVTGKTCWQIPDVQLHSGILCKKLKKRTEAINQILASEFYVLQQNSEELFFGLFFDIEHVPSARSNLISLSLFISISISLKIVK